MKNETTNENIQRFIIFLDCYFNKLYKIFQENKKQGFRLTIKVLQVIDILFQKLKGSELNMEARELISSSHSIIENTIKTNFDWRILRKMNDQSTKIKGNPEFNIKITNGFMGRLHVIKNALLWKKETETKKLVENIIRFLEDSSKTNPDYFEQSLI